MARTLKSIGNGNANLIQAALITRFASRHGMTPDAAAMIWIKAHGRAFRAFFNRHGI